MKAVNEELDELAASFQEAARAYHDKLLSDIGQVRSSVAALEGGKEPSQEKIRDLRDMLTLLRHFNIKPIKGRRKDLKKTDSLVEDLLHITSHW